MIRTAFITALTAAALTSAACFDFSSTITAPSGTAGAAALVGGWSSAQGATAQNSCTDFKWSVTQTSGSTATGTFSAVCFGNVTISGNASGSLANAVLTWSAAATAVVPGLATCPIALSGTAQMINDTTIQIPYSGTTCLGPVSGTETLKK